MYFDKDSQIIEIENKVQSLNREIKNLDIDFNAHIDTYRDFLKEEQDQKKKNKYKIISYTKKLTFLQSRYDLQHSILEKKKASWQKELLMIKKVKDDTEEKTDQFPPKRFIIPSMTVSRLMLFMDVIKDLEGEKRVNVPEKVLVTELVKTEKFTKLEAHDYIRLMLREASIYESKPRHYNSV